MLDSTQSLKNYAYLEILLYLMKHNNHFYVINILVT